MPWLIQHKCQPTDPTDSPYAILRTTRDGLDLTKVQCPRDRNGCGEEFIIIGHEMFTEAERMPESQRAFPALSGQGFVIAQGKKP